jgi:Zinc finger, ZZ type
MNAFDECSLYLGFGLVACRGQYRWTPMQWVQLGTVLSGVSMLLMSDLGFMTEVCNLWWYVVKLCLYMQAFLSLCQGNHYQFDCYRRARHSSMMVLYHVHNPSAPAFASTCNSCSQEIDMGEGFRCKQCPDFDLCRSCRDQGVHNHHELVVMSLLLLF